MQRQWLAQHQAGFQIVGSRYSADTGRLREFATRNRLPHRFVDLDRDPAGGQLLEGYGATPAQSPAVLMRGGEFLLNPSDGELASAVGLATAPDPGSVYDLLVVGVGRAGLAASVYASSEGLRVATVDAGHRARRVEVDLAGVHLHRGIGLFVPGLLRVRCRASVADRAGTGQGVFVAPR